MRERERKERRNRAPHKKETFFASTVAPLFIFFFGLLSDRVCWDVEIYSFLRREREKCTYSYPPPFLLLCVCVCLLHIFFFTTHLSRLGVPGTPSFSFSFGRKKGKGGRFRVKLREKTNKQGDGTRPNESMDVMDDERHL